MWLFESHYKRRLPRLDQEEGTFIELLKTQYPEHANSILTKLVEQTEKVAEMYKTSRHSKYDLDGIYN